MSSVTVSELSESTAYEPYQVVTAKAEDVAPVGGLYTLLESMTVIVVLLAMSEEEVTVIVVSAALIEHVSVEEVV